LVPLALTFPHISFQLDITPKIPCIFGVIFNRATNSAKESLTGLNGFVDDSPNLPVYELA
jgi:hypothetical protein